MFYMKIREYYNTISDFYLKVCGNKAVSREDFLKIMKNLNLNFISTDIDAIWMKLDKSNKGKIYALNFKTLFCSHIEADLKFIITRIYQALNNYEITFSQLMRSITFENVYVQFSNIMEALKSIGIYYIIYIESQ